MSCRKREQQKKSCNCQLNYHFSQLGLAGQNKLGVKGLYTWYCSRWFQHLSLHVQVKLKARQKAFRKKGKPSSTLKEVLCSTLNITKTHTPLWIYIIPIHPVTHETPFTVFLTFLFNWW